MKALTAALAALTAVLTACAPTPAPRTAVVEVGPVLQFQVEVANTEQTQRAGLAGRTLSEGTGMLFPFAEREERQVWMAGMQTAIDAAWIVEDNVLATTTLDPCTLPDQSQCPRWTSPGDVDALLEVPAGTLAGIEPGTPVTIREEQP